MSSGPRARAVEAFEAFEAALPAATAAGVVAIWQEAQSGWSHEVAIWCQMCWHRAVVPLTARQLVAQPDDTTHVCHPSLGGCNHGFARWPP